MLTVTCTAWAALTKPQAPSIKQSVPQKENVAFVNSLVKLEGFEKQARALTAEYIKEEDYLINKKIDALTDYILEKIKKDIASSQLSTGKTKESFFDKIIKPFKAEKNLPGINVSDSFQTPLGPIEMSGKMKTIVEKLGVVDLAIDQELATTLKLVKSVPTIDRARLLAKGIDINFRRSQGGLHTEVYGLTEDPACKGDIITDGYIGAYFDNILAKKYSDALYYFVLIANHVATCVSMKQSREMDMGLLDAYETMVNLYANAKGTTNIFKDPKAGVIANKPQLMPQAYDETIKLLNAAFYNLGLLVYDINKANFSALQWWFCKNGGMNIPEFGVWLYDRKKGSVTEAKFKPGDKASLQCAAIDKAIVEKGLTYYGISFEYLVKICSEPNDGVALGELTFAKFGQNIADPEKFSVGLQGFLETAAVDRRDDTLCGGAGPAPTGGGSFNCQTPSGGGHLNKCAPAYGSWPDMGGVGLEVPESPIDVAWLRAAALCGSMVGNPDEVPDPLDTANLPPLQNVFPKVTEKKWEKPEKKKEETTKEQEEAMKKLKEDSKKEVAKSADAAASAAQTVCAKNGQTCVGEEGTGFADWDKWKAAYLEGAYQGIDNAQIGQTGATCVVGGVFGNTNDQGQITMDPQGLPGSECDNAAFLALAHEGIHAGLIKVGMGAKTKSNQVDHHYITKKAGTGCSKHCNEVAAKYGPNYPNPSNSSDMMNCTAQAMGSFLSPNNCKKMSYGEEKEWCNKPDSGCGGPFAGNQIAGGDGGGGSSGGMSPTGTTGGPAGPDYGPDSPKEPGETLCSVDGGPKFNPLMLMGYMLPDVNPAEFVKALPVWMQQNFQNPVP